MLVALQAVDLQCDELEDKQDEIEERLAGVSKVLGSLKVDLQAQEERLQSTIDLQREKQGELDELEGRYRDSKVRLTKVANSREYSAIEQKIENLKRMTTQIEEELVHLLEAIEATQASIAEKSEKVAALEGEIGQEADRAGGESQQLAQALDKLTAERDRLAAEISPPLLRRYDRIRDRFANAIVAAIGGACQGCFMNLPPQLYIEAQRGTKLLQCPSCRRIMYHEEAAPSPPAE